MTDQIKIPSGAILNCYLPKKKGSIKRSIMNLEAKIIKKKFGFEKLLNHTAVIEKSKDNVLIWEATVFRGVAPTELSLYNEDCVFIITQALEKGSTILERIKSQSGKSYDVKSWFTYLRFIVSGKWAKKQTFAEYSKKWFCSEIVDYAAQLSETPERSTPNHVYQFTKHNELWSGTYADLRYGIKTSSILITE